MTTTRGDIVFGADNLVEKYSEGTLKYARAFPVDWSRLGKKAGPVRNQQMVDYATHLVAFWDGKGAETINVIELARKKGLVVRVVKII